MEIYILDRRLAKMLNSEKKLRKEFGNRMAEKIKQRLDDMKHAESLEELLFLPGRHHSLTGDKSGLFACDLVHPYRLIYRPGNNPLPIDESGRLDCRRITVIEVVCIDDYHHHH